MIKKVEAINLEIKDLKLSLRAILKEAANTDNLEIAWPVYRSVEKHLPYDIFVIEEKDFPALHKIYDDNLNNFNRNEFVNFSRLVDLATGLEDLYDLDKMKWEAITSGKAGFHFDW